jgi:NADH-ubiquinone oxidoreductase chain 6
MLGINFIGLSYLLVYVGAVSILFIFILMLINIRISELVDNSSNNIPLAILIGIFFNLSLGKLFVNQITLINFSEIFFLNYEKVFYTQSNTIYTNLEYILNNFINNELSFVTSYA